MQRRPLGHTGLTVAAIGFGCGNVGGLMVRGDPGLRSRAVAMALAAGVTYFDTAAQYGDGRSEEHLGAALREAGALTSVAVGTKVRLPDERLAEPGQALREALAAGLRRLGRDYVDVLHLHNRVAGSLDPVADAMGRLVAEGLVRHAGITGLGDTQAIGRAVASGGFATMQTYLNVLNPSAFWAGASGGAQDFAGVGRQAADAGMGVLAIRVMAAGAVAGPGPRPALAGGVGGALAAGGDYAGDLARVAALAALPAELGLEGGMAELALRFALSVPAVSTALVGFSDLAQVEQAVRWGERGALPQDAVDRVVAAAR